MRFRETDIQGVFVIDIEPIRDERGFFARINCVNEFEENGLNTTWVQENISFNTKKGIFRGMHLQTEPHQEIKLVRCIQGAIYDIVLDLRPDSQTYKRSLGIELTADNYRMLYIPEGIAHGFQTLIDNTEVHYHMSEFYYPQSAKGYRWDDPAWDIELPLPISLIAERDRTYPNFVS